MRAAAALTGSLTTVASFASDWGGEARLLPAGFFEIVNPPTPTTDRGPCLSVRGAGALVRQAVRPVAYSLSAVGFVSRLIVPSDIEREAQRFMDSYTADLRRHDRAALAARYDRDGATVIFNGDRNTGTSMKSRHATASNGSGRSASTGMILPSRFLVRTRSS